MTDTLPSPTSSAPRKRGGGLGTMLLADLRTMATGMAIDGAGIMKKAQLVDAIKQAQAAPAAPAPAAVAPEPTPAPAESAAKAAGAPVVTTRTRKSTARRVPRTEPTTPEPAATEPTVTEPAAPAAVEPAAAEPESPPPARRRTRSARDEEAAAPASEATPAAEDIKEAEPAPEMPAPAVEQPPQTGQDTGQDTSPDGGSAHPGEEDGRSGRNRRRRGRDRNRTGAAVGGQAPLHGQAGQGGQGGQGGQTGATGNQGGQGNQANQANQVGQGNHDRQDRHDRHDRTQGQGGSSHQREPDTTVYEDDVLVPAAGILDVLDNYAFVRTSGYLPGADDVYVSLSMVRKFGLRRGDAIVGQVRQPREGERREKFNPLVRIDGVNGVDPDTARTRPDFAKLTPLHPTERLRLETDRDNLIGRVIDIASPVGKGQRGLIVSPAEAGKTTVLQSIASSVTTNNPECHLMVVLVDERPEEVTDFERSVKGEVIASTFDRPPADHTIVAELAIERAKRLVELGHDVVVLLDGITRLGRAYNMVGPSSGRVLPGGVDSAALHPPKRFFGAARNIENGGSLTILATALVESGSTTDEVILEELQGTGNLEIRLRGDLAEKRLFPAIDAVASSTRHEEHLMSSEELAIVWKLRRALAGLDGQEALELLLERLRRSQSNIEFLMQVQKTSLVPGAES